MRNPPRLLTVGIIAEQLGVRVDRVARLLRTRPHIRPAAFAGNTRLFTSDAIAMIRYELNRIDARRSRARGGMRDG